MIMKLAIPMALMATALLVGCASAPKTEPVAACVFADGSNQPAPEWVCGAPVDGVELSAVGYADKSAAGVNFMKQMAATAARVELRSEEHTSELQSRPHLVCRLLLEKKKKKNDK